MEKKETLDAVEERIKALEEEVRAQKEQNKRLRVVIAALVVLAVLPYLIAAGMQTQTFNVLRVERIEFVKDGELVAAIAGGEFLYLGSLGSGLGIHDKDGKPVVVIGSITGGLLDGSRGIFLASREKKPAIGLITLPDGGADVCVLNNEGKIVADLGTTGELQVPNLQRGSGYLTISDANKKAKISFHVNPEGDGVIQVAHRDGEPAVNVMGTDTGGRIEISRSPHLGNTKLNAITLFVTENGLGQIGITNSLGLPIWSTPLR